VEILSRGLKPTATFLSSLREVQAASQKLRCAQFMLQPYPCSRGR
jgi:hypothetical protein